MHIVRLISSLTILILVISLLIMVARTVLIGNIGNGHPFLFPYLIVSISKVLHLSAIFAIVLITFTKSQLLLCSANLLRVIVNRY